MEMEGSTSVKSWLRCYRCWSQDLEVQVLLDGKPVPASVAGADVQGGQVTVRGQRLYSLVSLPGDEQHTLKVVVPPGVSAYDFTFG